MLEASLRLRFFVATGKCRAGALAALTDESVRALVERTGGVFNNGLVVYDGSGTIVHERVLANVQRQAAICNSVGVREIG